MVLPTNNSTSASVRRVIAVWIFFSARARALLSTLKKKHASAANLHITIQRRLDHTVKRAPTMGTSRNHQGLINTIPILSHVLKYLAALLIMTTVSLLVGQPEALALLLSPNSLSFTGTQGATNPPAQSITFWKRDNRTKSWTASSPVSWVTVNPPSGSLASERDTITVGVTHSGLAPGNYTTSLMITTVGPRGGIGKTAVPIMLTVNPTAPAISLSPAMLSFNGTAGGANPAALTIGVSNTGGGTLSWTATDNAAWLTLSPASGTNSGSITAAVNLGGLAAGTYSSAITISATGASTKTVPVTLTVAAPTAPPSISFSPSGLSFSGTAGGTSPAAKTLTISNSGGSTLAWTATDNTAWLTLSPSSGTNTGTVNASVNLSGLAAGTYNATVTLAAAGAITKTVPVTLTVTALTSGGTIALSPTSLTFSGTLGGANPASKTVSLTNPGGGTLTWSISDNANWLTVSPVSGTTTTEADTLTAAINLSGLAAGTYNGVITITASGSSTSPRTIPVTLTLTAASANTATLLWSANMDTDLAGYKVYRSTASGTYGAAVATLGKTVTSYVSSGLQTGTTYFFVITAYDSAGNESSYSNEVSKSIF